MVQYETVVISDLHLGARNSRTDELLRFFDWVDTAHLVVAGDLFDRPHLGRLRPDELRILQHLRDFAESGRLEWVRGNHDPDEQFIRSVLGIDSVRQTRIHTGDMTYLVCHGDEWDESMSYPQWLIAAADGVYRTSQMIDRSHSLARFLKRRCKSFVRAVNGLAQGAVEAARELGVDGVIVGHSHVSSDCVTGGIHYLNCGCWTEKPSTFVGMRDGVARKVCWESADRSRAVFAPLRRRASSMLVAPLAMHSNVTAGETV